MDLFKKPQQPRRKRRHRGRILTEKEERTQIFEEEIEILSEVQNYDENLEEEGLDEKREKNKKVKN